MFEKPFGMGAGDEDAARPAPQKDQDAEKRKRDEATTLGSAATVSGTASVIGASGG